MRVAVGLSGGVDSAVAAARLLEAGHEVTGVHYAFSRRPGEGAAPDARAVADFLGIGFENWDFSDAFREQIMGYFVDTYEAGRTPNPCVRCNSTMKFGTVLERALASGFDALATGHYARVEHDGGETVLRRAVDSTKDQSYVLAVLRPDQLARVVFPLGGSTKREVRAEAARRGIPVACKPDSLDICFIPDGDTAGFLARRLGVRPGTIVDSGGAVLGEHAGAHGFTIGQRKGLRLGRPAADGQPRYVTGVDPASNTVTVGPRQALQVARIECAPASWTTASLTGEFRALVQVRAHGEPMPARVRVSGSATSIELDAPAYGIAPGQAAVFYDGDRALGLATIESTAP